MLVAADAERKRAVLVAGAADGTDDARGKEAFIRSVIDGEAAAEAGG